VMLVNIKNRSKLVMLNDEGVLNETV
jgi:hypothetical protein